MSAYYHPLRFDETLCTCCMSCLRACPTQAIRVHGGHAVMLEDRCIDCGECLKACSKGAVVPLTDDEAGLARFRRKVAVPCPALYVQFGSEVTPGTVLEALKLCGFDDAATVTPHCEALTRATELFFGEYEGPYPLISSFCPAVVRLIQIKYPHLVAQLMPLLPPRELAAKEMKARQAEETGLPPEAIAAVYITPCPAKMVSVADGPGAEVSYFDSAVSIRDIFKPLSDAVTVVREKGVPVTEAESAGGVSWAFLGGVPRSVPAEHSLCVAGLPNVVRILDDVEKGRLRGYTYLECHGCSESCVSGSLTVENPYVARARAIRLAQASGEGKPADEAQVEQLYRQSFYRLRHFPEPRPLKPLDPDLAAAIGKMRERERIRSRLPGIDCCACGAPSCEAFAEDVALGLVEERSCVFVRQRQVGDAVEHLRELVQTPGDGRGQPPGGRR